MCKYLFHYVDKVGCINYIDISHMQVTWFSSGGTRSVIHHDDLDNINCLFRGTKKLIFVNYDNYGKYLPLDQGGYSSIDVDKVDYVKFPELRNIKEYVLADMEAGDCLFIPYKWYVSSFALHKFLLL